MPTITEKLQKFFRLEASQGYANRAVLGGLQRLAESWPAEAREAGIEESIIPTVTRLLRQYQGMPAVERRDALIKMSELVKLPNARSFPEALYGGEAGPEKAQAKGSLTHK